MIKIELCEDLALTLYNLLDGLILVTNNDPDSLYMTESERNLCDRLRVVLYYKSSKVREASKCQ